jgi:putative hemolysin
LAVFLAGYYIKSIPQNGTAFALFIIVPVLIVSLSVLLFGEMLPRFMAGFAPEKTVAVTLPVLKIFHFLLRPFIFLAMRFGSFLRTVFQLDANSKGMTEDELRIALMEGEKSGIVESAERTMVEAVLYLGDRPVGAFMTHRSDVQYLDINDPPQEIRAKALEFRNQRCYPVTNGSPDEIVGAVYLEDIILDQSKDNPQGLTAIMKKAQFVPQTMSALKAFESFKQGQANFLFVIDEYGGLAGVISIRALMEEIVGELEAPHHNEKPLIRQENGTWIADGLLNIDEAAETLFLPSLADENSSYHTLAGFVLSLAGELPQAGDSFKYEGYRFTVQNMDGNRIDKLLIVNEGDNESISGNSTKNS